MSPSRICQTLHDEHQSTVLFVERLEAMLGGHRGVCPDRDDAAAASLLRDLPHALGRELRAHFDFEEVQLFPRLAQEGDPALGALLTEEHAAMQPLLARLLSVGAVAQAQGFDEASWSQFRAAAGELCGQLSAHVLKEEMALLPVIEESLDAESDAGLYDIYAGNCGEISR